MDRLAQRLNTFSRALVTLEQVLRQPKSDLVRDASIQRFEYTFEAAWKTAQLFLRDREGLENASPKNVIRASGQVGLLQTEQVELALAMADDRNLTAHTYNEGLADAIYCRLPGYCALLREWLEAMTAGT